MKFKASAFQLRADTNWQNALEKAAKAAEEAKGQKSELLVLPELFPFGIIKTRKEAQGHAANTPEIISRLQALADSLKISFSCGLPFKKEDGRIFNSQFFIRPGKRPLCYNKLHLFPPFHEPEVFAPGTSLKTFPVSTSAGQFLAGPMICYDIRFPELARRLCQEGVQLFAVSSLWPLSRRDNFITLLRARAMENQCFLIAANGCGVSRDTELAGSSLIAAPDGSILAKAGMEESLITADIDLSRISSLREFFNSSWPRGRWYFPVSSKILSLEKLKTKAQARKNAGQTMVFTNGCFDLLHAGHVSYLRQARLLGDFLVVGLNSDDSLRRIKGESRPVNRQEHRALVLAGLSFVDYVVIFGEDTPERLIKEIVPDVLVKGADWEEDKIVGARFVKSWGGRVERIRFDVEISTSSIIRKIKRD